MNARPRVLVIGAGSIGERHVRCFQATGRVDVGVCEPNQTVRDTVQAKYGIEESFESFGTALAAQFDLAVVAAPAQFHVAQARLLIERGIHPLVEKPLSLEVSGIDDLDAAAAARSMTAGVAYPYRAHPAVRRNAHRAIAAGQFGRPLEVVVVAGQHFPTYRPAYRNIYYADRATGGGAIQDALTHLIRAVEWIVGPTTRVVADAAHLKLEGITVEDTAHVLNQHQPANELTITVICAVARPASRATAKWSWITEVDGPWQEETFTLDRDTLLQRQATAFIDAVAQRQSPLCTIGQGRDTVETVLAILASLESMRWEQVGGHRT